MKKFFLLLLTLVLVFTSTKSVFCETFKFGDINNDNRVDSTDYVLLKKYLINNIPYHEYTTNNGTSITKTRIRYNLKAADVNLDWNVNNIDLMIMIEYLKGEVEYLPISKNSEDYFWIV